MRKITLFNSFLQCENELIGMFLSDNNIHAKKIFIIGHLKFKRVFNKYSIVTIIGIMFFYLSRNSCMEYEGYIGYKCMGFASLVYLYMV